MSANSFSFRRIRRRAISREASNPAKKEAPQEQFFFGSAGTQPSFFQPANISRKCEACTQEENKIQKQEESVSAALPPGIISTINSESNTNPEEKTVAELYTKGKGTSIENKTAYGCEGVEVEGKTVANYDHGTYHTEGKTTQGKTCKECSGNDCITFNGNVISVFKANPVITLPDVPGHLSICEKAAVKTFILTTLKKHEQDHVTAFKTYDGKVVTPFVFNGCRNDFAQHVLDMHNQTDNKRITDANYQSNLLDPFKENIPCDCPEGTTKPVKSEDQDTSQEKK